MWHSVELCGKCGIGCGKIPHWGSAPYQDHNKVANWILLFNRGVMNRLIFWKYTGVENDSI